MSAQSPSSVRPAAPTAVARRHATEERPPEFKHGAHTPPFRTRQQGAALILALLTMSFAAMIAAAALADIGDGLARHSGRHDQAQARQLALGAIDWARNILAQDDRNSQTDHLGETWATRIPATPLGENPELGTVGGQIDDLSGRFNLNLVAPDGQADPDMIEALARLLEGLGNTPAEASTLAHGISRHLASGATNRSPALIVPGELQQAGILSLTQLARLDPYVIALPTPSRLNVNTAPAEVLAAFVPGLSLDQARVMVAGRERAWFRDLADFRSRLPEGVRLADTEHLDVRTRYFLIRVHTRYGEAFTRMEALAERVERWPTILWHRQQ